MINERHTDLKATRYYDCPPFSLEYESADYNV